MEPQLTKRIDASEIQALLKSTQSLEPKAVGIQFLVMFVLSVMTITAFNVLRPNNQDIYEPKLKYHAHGQQPTRITNSCCGYLPALLTDEERLVSQVGLDAVTFLRFLRLTRWLLTLTAVFSCGILVPLDLLYTISLKLTSFDILAATTIQNVEGIRLYAHIGVVYIITIFLVSLVFHHWRVIHELRTQWLASPDYQRLFYARTIYIRDIPRRRQSTFGIYGIFDRMQLPYPVTSAHIGKNVGELPELIKIHNNLVEEFEQTLLQFEQGKKYQQNETLFVTTGGCCGIGGRRVDAIKYYTDELKRTEAIVQQYRAQVETREPENYGFATIASIPLAHAAARELKGMHPKGLTFELAPNPNDIIWKNMGLSKAERRFRVISGFLILYMSCFLSLIPLFPIASLANLDAIAASGYIPFLQTWLNHSPATYTLVSGLLPPAIAGIFGSFIPVLMRWLSKYMGESTHTGLDRIVIARYFAFLVISQLIFFTVIGVIFNSILEIIIAIRNQGSSLKLVLDNLDKLPGRLARTYVDQSSFWLKWFALNGFLVIFDLARFFDLIRTAGCRSRLTPREIRERSKPPVFGYDIYYSKLLFMALIGLLFAPVAPLVSLASSIVFWLCSGVYKYQLMYKFISRVETGGRAWIVVTNRLIFSCIFMQTVMVITIGFQAQFKSLKFLVTIPPILGTLLFKYYLTKRFETNFEYYIPSPEVVSRSRTHSSDADISEEKLRQRYDNPALHNGILSPMVHARMMPLLQSIYAGRRSHTRTRGISDRAVSDTSAVGVPFIPVNEDELEYDPKLYKRDRELDCDFDSVNETSSNARPHRTSPPMHHNSAPGASTMLTRELGYERDLPDIPDTGIHAPEAIVSSRRVSRDRKPSLSSPGKPAISRRNLEPARLRGAGFEHPTDVEESVTRPSWSQQSMQHGFQNDGGNLKFNPSREQNTRSQRNSATLSSENRRHNQVSDQHPQRTHQKGRDRHPKSPHRETDTSQQRNSSGQVSQTEA